MRTTLKFGLLTATLMATAPVMTGFAMAQTAETPAAATTETMAVTTAPIAIVGLPDGYVFVESAMVTGDELKGVDLYDTAGDKIAKVEDIVIGPDDKLTGVLVDVGGFLGLGAHKVELKPDQLQVYQNDKKDMRAYTALTKDELKALPKYEGAK